MRRVIVSAEALLKTLQLFVATVTYLDGDNGVDIVLSDKKIQFADFEKLLFVESSVDWQIKVELSQLRRLVGVLKHLNDQPLVITFENSSGWIQIDNVVI